MKGNIKRWKREQMRNYRPIPGPNALADIERAIERHKAAQRPLALIISGLTYIVIGTSITTAILWLALKALNWGIQ